MFRVLSCPANITPTVITCANANLCKAAVLPPAPSSLQPLQSLNRVRCLSACCTGRGEFSELALRVLDALAAEPEPPAGLAPIMVDPETGRFASKTVSLGARGDSYYEYLLKQWLLSGKTDERLLRCVLQDRLVMTPECGRSFRAASAHARRAAWVRTGVTFRCHLSYIPGSGECG